ncbi:hypothetical protein H7U35_03990 [Mediterranea massiliensis]|uniref:Uncharacterized protein n=1 Tax=Mediterranea massiliensis TaxID=1841865 RepID=A0ABS2DY29_9BACT|nr:hypothetical protein [Mediterranea massiliensis]MBM6734391.1 hypothetical protein [Mediterranea massiliensis]
MEQNIAFSAGKQCRIWRGTEAAFRRLLPCLADAVLRGLLTQCFVTLSCSAS